MSTWLMPQCRRHSTRRHPSGAGQADSVQAVFGADAEALKDNIIEIL
jgi:hypothetical protein